jgi:glutathione S-transferase
MLQGFEYTALVSLLALLVYIWTSLKVGGARAKYKTPAPATSGPPEFERAFRVQMNTLEQIVLFLPVLWLFAAVWGDKTAAVIGVIWPIGRIIYARAYYVAAEKRGPGFGLTFLPSIVLLLGALAGIVKGML